jgi:hypothetical protein
MFSGKFFLAVIVVAVVVSFIQWLVIGSLFHKYQAATPMTWRKESSRSYAASTILALLFAFMFTYVLSFWMSRNIGMDPFNGMEFGLVCWLSFAIPLEIGTAIYVNYSKMFVVGKCLSSLLEYVAAGAVVVALL